MVLISDGLSVTGSIFKATHLHTHQVVALKVQYVNHECPTNRYERHLYPLLQGGVGMPKLYAAGVQGAWDYLAIDLLGPSLDNLYRRSGKDMMDLRTVCSIAIQVVSSIFLILERTISKACTDLDRSNGCNSCTIVGYCTGISS